MRKAFAALLVGAVSLLNGCTSVPENGGSTAPLTAAGTQSPQHFHTQLTQAVDFNYLLYLPKGYSKMGQKWPLMLFLHGAGERGTNLDKVTVHGPPKLVKTGKDFPFVLVSPQCPDHRIWHDDELLKLLDRIIAQQNIDTNRIYLTGLSMGGYGSWSLGTRYPERFAAIAPICGGGELLPILLVEGEKKQALTTLGVWAFHGGKDPVVPLDESKRMTNALIRAGNKDVKLTIYPAAGHDSWTQAYNDPALWTWFLAHQRQ